MKVWVNDDDVEAIALHSGSDDMEGHRLIQWFQWWKVTI
jgi:hypothetical protein